jgi:hypothetical protein
MNVRISAVLVLVLALIASYVFLFELGKPSEESGGKSPWFYDLAMSEIEEFTVTYEAGSETFIQAPDGTWHFDAFDGAPVHLDKFSGMTLLLSGPRSKRKLEGDNIDPAAYGLESPISTIIVGMDGGRRVSVELGDITPDEKGQYVRLVGESDIFIVTNAWGDVLTNLVKNPPYVSTPVQESEGSSEVKSTSEETASP